MASKAATAGQIRVTQTRSLIGEKPNARASVQSLGLKRIHHSVLVDDTPQIRGYVQAARHLVKVEDAASTTAATGVTSK